MQSTSIGLISYTANKTRMKFEPMGGGGPGSWGGGVCVHDIFPISHFLNLLLDTLDTLYGTNLTRATSRNSAMDAKTDTIVRKIKSSALRKIEQLEQSELVPYMNNKMNFIEKLEQDRPDLLVEQLYRKPLVMITRLELCQFIKAQHFTINTLIAELKKVAPNHELFSKGGANSGPSNL